MQPLTVCNISLDVTGLAMENVTISQKDQKYDINALKVTQAVITCVGVFANTVTCLVLWSRYTRMGGVMRYLFIHQSLVLYTIRKYT